MSDHAIEDRNERLDSTGHCLDHLQIRVRRPNANGVGWRTILTNGCPLCAINPVKSSTRKSSTRNVHALTVRDSSRRSVCDETDFHKCSSSASDITETTVASSQSSLSCNSNLDDFSGPISPQEATRKRIVCGMSYVDPSSGRVGTYTGQVCRETQVPHGMGCLRSEGDVINGEWSTGRLVHRQDTQHGSRHPSRSRRENISESLRSCHLEDDESHRSLSRHPSRSRRESLSRFINFDEDELQSQNSRARDPSRSKRESLRSLSRSCHFDEDDNSIGDNSLNSHGERTVGTYSARESKNFLPKQSGGADRCPSRYCEMKR